MRRTANIAIHYSLFPTPFAQSFTPLSACHARLRWRRGRIIREIIRAGRCVGAGACEGGAGYLVKAGTLGGEPVCGVANGLIGNEVNDQMCETRERPRQGRVRPARSARGRVRSCDCRPGGRGSGLPGRSVAAAEPPRPATRLIRAGAGPACPSAQTATHRRRVCAANRTIQRP